MEGELPEKSFYSEFVGKFCYDYREPEEEVAGELQVQLIRESPIPDTSSGKLYFMIFDDEGKHWKRARRRWAISSCEEKMQDASLSRELDLHSDSQEETFQIHIREHLRPRFWYFTFVACGIDSDLELRYQIHATNDLWGWQKEFSLDHMGMLGVQCVFMVLFLISLMGTAWASRRGSSMAGPSLREHPYLKLLMLSYVASVASSVLFLMHYGLFVNDGFGSKRIRFLGVLAATVANCTIFLLVILASVSWAITLPVLPNRRVFLGLVALVGGVNAACELHAEVMVDQSTQLYNYQSVPGILSLMLKVFMFCWIAFQTKATHDEETNKQLRLYYKWLGVCMALWSINVPITAMLAHLVSPWYRYKVVTGVEIAARFLGQALLSQLFCGSSSPITAENTFLDRDLIDLGDDMHQGLDVVRDTQSSDAL